MPYPEYALSMTTCVPVGSGVRSKSPLPASGSFALPFVRENATPACVPAAIRWIFVLKPPWDLPRAWGPFF